MFFLILYHLYRGNRLVYIGLLEEVLVEVDNIVRTWFLPEVFFIINLLVDTVH